MKTGIDLVEQIQKEYPSPVKSSYGEHGRFTQWKDDAYCVGGACILYLRENDRSAFEHLGIVGNLQTQFPAGRPLTRVLLLFNDRLPKDTAYGFACNIINLNDTGHFDAAWQALRTAVMHRPLPKEED